MDIRPAVYWCARAAQQADEGVHVRKPSESGPEAAARTQGLAAMTVVAALVLAVALPPGVAGAQGHAKSGTHAPRAGHRPSGAAGRGKRRSHRRHSARTAHRSAARRRRHREHRQAAAAAGISPAPASAPEPTPSAEPTPAPAPDPEASPTPTPNPGPAPEPAPAPSGAVLFRGDFDAGFAGWYVQSLSSRVTLFSAGAFQGTQAARFEVRDGDVEPDTGSERSEVSGPTFDEGQDLYIRDAIRIPGASSYQGPWQIVQQLHEVNWGSSPGLAVFLEADDSLRLGPGDGSRAFWQSADLQPDRWYDLVYRVKLSQDSQTGFVEVWLDGAQQSLLNGQTRIYGQTIQAAQTYLKAGIYRSQASTGTSIVEHDAIVVGTSLAAVSAG